MRRQLVHGLIAVALLATTARGGIDMTGTWALCGDCREAGGVCDPLYSPEPTFTDTWTVTQTGVNVHVTSAMFGGSLGTYDGTIDTASGAFTFPNPPNFIEFEGVATFSTFTGSYDSTLESGGIFGARQCNPLSPACDDDDACTDDTCVASTVGTCTDMTPVPVCINAQNGSCTTTTSTSTSSSTTTSSLPLGHYPVTGSRLIVKKSASGRETLIFVTKDPTAFVPAAGSGADPSTITTQVEVYSPVGNSSYGALQIPAGAGNNPGWTVDPVKPLYQFKNSFAPAGVSVVRQVKLQQGKGLKIVARETGLSMTHALGGAGISFRLSPYSGYTPVICAHFGAATIRKDVAPIFIARNAPAPTNCNPFTLSQP